MSLPVVIEITFEDNDVEEEVESEYFNEYRYLSDENGQYSGYIDEDWDIEPQPLVLEFKCQHCGKLYENDDKLRRHLRNHQERKQKNTLEFQTHIVLYCYLGFLSSVEQTFK